MVARRYGDSAASPPHRREPLVPCGRSLFLFVNLDETANQ
jgi:hypothetical protein